MRIAIVARSRERDRCLRTINPINFHYGALRGLPCGCSIFMIYLSEQKSQEREKESESDREKESESERKIVFVGGASFSFAARLVYASSCIAYFSRLYKYILYIAKKRECIYYSQYRELLLITL